MRDMLLMCADLRGAPADVEKNRDESLRQLRRAEKAGALLLLLPPLSLTGASCGDLFFQDLLLQSTSRAASQLAAMSRRTTLVFGLPIRIEGQLYAASAVCWGGQLRGLVMMTALSHEQRRWFSPWEGDARSVLLHGQTVPVGTDLIFDLSGSDVRLGIMQCKAEEAMQKAEPLLKRGADLLAVQAFEPTLAGVQYKKREHLRQLSARCACLYQNAGSAESTTDAVFGGEAFIMASGEVLAERGAFALQSHIIAPVPMAQGGIPGLTFEARQEIIVSDTPYAPPEGPLREDWCRDAIEIPAQGLATRMARIKAKTAVLGLSGGLDSALALLISARALEINRLPQDSLLAYSLPCFGTTGRTRGNSLKLMAALGLPTREIDISRSVRAHFEDIGHDGRFDAAYENAQARERTQVLMDIANMRDGLMVGTGDMSELALGFTTFGGDHLSMYAVNGGLYKSAIRLILAQMANQAAPALKEVLFDILDTPISPELKPLEEGQHTEKIVGPYALNDFYLYHVLNQGLDPQTLLHYAQTAFAGRFTRLELLKWMRVFFQRYLVAQFKRSCMSDGPQVLAHSLSPRGGLSLPSDAQAILWLKDIDRMTRQEESS